MHLALEVTTKMRGEEGGGGGQEVCMVLSLCGLGCSRRDPGLLSEGREGGLLLLLFYGCSCWSQVGSVTY